MRLSSLSIFSNFLLRVRCMRRSMLDLRDLTLRDRQKFRTLLILFLVQSRIFCTGEKLDLLTFSSRGNLPLTLVKAFCQISLARPLELPSLAPLFPRTLLTALFQFFIALPFIDFFCTSEKNKKQRRLCILYVCVLCVCVLPTRRCHKCHKCHKIFHRFSENGRKVARAYVYSACVYSVCVYSAYVYSAYVYSA